MKRNFLKGIFLIVFMAAISTGCKKWLDVNPKTQIRESLLLENEQGFQDALIGVYLKMGSSSLYGQNLTMGFVDVMAQYYRLNSGTFFTASHYEYEDAGVKSYYSSIWRNAYDAIGNLNEILGQIETKKQLFTGDNYQKIKGQSLALRAMLHFDLLRLFGSAPVVDASKPAIPYVTEFGVDVFPVLSTQDVIGKCMTDLSAAEELLSEDKAVSIRGNPNPTSNYMNYWAVKGLEARIHLYNGDKAEALAAAKEVINNQELFPFVALSAASANLNRDRSYATEQLFSLNVFKLKSYTEAYTKTAVVNSPPTLYTTTTNLKKWYETSSGGSSDIRFNYQFEQYSGGYATSKYWQDGLADIPELKYLSNIIPLIRLSEMYYIAAECSTEPSEGVIYLNTVRKNRGLADLDAGISSESLKNEIFKAYRKEFYAEGQLFFFYKRLNESIISGYSGDATQIYVVPLPDDEKEFGKRP